jgi:hypothetical protein
MIRALHTGLGIPAEVLLQEPGRQLAPNRFDVEQFPFAEMVRQQYFPGFQGSLKEAKEVAEELLEALFAPFQALSPSASITANRFMPEPDLCSLWWLNRQFRTRLIMPLSST